MKRNRPYNTIPIALLAGLFCLFGNTEVSALTYEHTLNIPLSDITISTDTIKGELRSRIGVDDGSEYINKDTLLLPMKNLRFKVPLLAEDFRIKSWNVNSSAPISMDYRPAKYLPEPPHHHYESESEKIDEDPYADFDPTSISSDPVVLMGDYYLGAEEHYLNVGIHAAEYSGSQLKANTSVSFIIEYSMKDEAAIADSPLARTVNMAKASKNVKSLETFALSVDPFDLTAINIQNYVILVPKALESGVTRLKNWKRQKGYKVTVKTFEDIYNDPFYSDPSVKEAFDHPAQVRHWMKDFYNLNGDFYCLIIGDYTTSAPIRKFRYFLSNDIKDLNSSRYNPSDVYFSDLMSDFSHTLDQTGIYAAICDNYKFSPTVPVGRLLCRSIKELDIYTNKLIVYENYPGYGDDQYLSKGFLGRHYSAITTKSEDYLASMSEWDTKVLIDTHTQYLDDCRPLASEVLEAMETSGIISMQYHGSPTSFEICKSPQEPNFPYTRHIVSRKDYRDANRIYWEDPYNYVSMLNNINKPSILYSMSCTISPFDDIRVGDLILPENPVNISSVLTMEGDYGSVAVLGNTREGFYPTSTYLESEFFKLTRQCASIGVTENISKLQSLRTFGGILDLRHNLIGDPELAIWCGHPITNSPICRIANRSIYLSGLSGEEMRYSLICGNYLLRGRFAGDSEISIPLNSVFTREISNKLGYMMIKDYNRLPYHVLITSGNIITNCQENLIVRNLLLKNTNMPITPINSISTTPYLWCGEGTDIVLHSMDNIESKSGIRIGKAGRLNLSAEKSITLNGDIVESGGILNVKSETVTLDGGFCVEKGGELTINND